MGKLDFEVMSLDELWELHERVSTVLSARMLAEKQELESRLARLNGGNPTASVERPRPRRKYPQVFPKYQNPLDPRETWAGRGKQPRWLVVALKAGGKIDDFRIPADDERLHARGSAAAQ